MFPYASLEGASVEQALQSVYFRTQPRTSRVPALSVQPGSAPAGAKCSPRAHAGQRAPGRSGGPTDLPIAVSIVSRVVLVRTFFSFSMWSDKHTFINDYKVLKADIAKLLAQIEQSYV
jgi:hypothetical protein